MRPPRVVIGAAFLIAAAFLTVLSVRSSRSPTVVSSSAAAPKTGISALFSFRAPFSIFPPNAIITLTHDNTTAFLARPAAFGPLLPNDGLKGQLWIGSGFGDDSVRQGIATSSLEGEQGCSDVPGWVDGYAMSGAARLAGTHSGDRMVTSTSKTRSKRGAEADAGDDLSASRGERKQQPSAGDGTDDHLHLPGSQDATDKHPAVLQGSHADIQSLQEGAEIAGKVVLLSRGGCGFLEKVKWVQRRGGLALIVGDDTKGGPLIQMYARGDTSNVTIPAIFTSRTTAHLLSSLIGTGAFNEDVVDDKGRSTLKVQHGESSRKPKSKQIAKPFSTTTLAGSKATALPKSNLRASRRAALASETKTLTTKKNNWFRALFFGRQQGKPKSATRPPSSGQLDWVLVNDWKDDDTPKKVSAAKSADSKTPMQAVNGRPAAGDDFVIGVQDWRDPDLVGATHTKYKDTNSKYPSSRTGVKPENPKVPSSASKISKAGRKASAIAPQSPGISPALRGGSTKPGSGEYISKTDQREKSSMANPKDTAGKTKGILNTIFGEDNEDFGVAPSVDGIESEEAELAATDEDEGLWVTLTPTSGASPFLDTLLVLVVSPLVTLTVVYALLLIRSRIRRRRWRAPKSVVERLPVRTYQTIASTGSQSPRMPSPTSSSPTTPLLLHSASTTTIRPRPRSRTTTGIPEPGELTRVNSGPLQASSIPSHGREHEKPAASPSQWKKYMGRQIECVVCLEEYVDGVSRVMSLPCGHEFHVDCITPWLTTRRRTCPICKGDVVRSLARGTPSSPRYEPYLDDSDDDMQAQAVEATNAEGSSAVLIPRAADHPDDLEQGSSASSSRVGRGGSWRSYIANSLGAAVRSPRPPQDRSR